MRFGRWKFTFAFLAVTAFALVTGHESIHVDHPSHCKVCQVKQIAPADLPAAAAFAVFLAVVFSLFASVFSRPVSSTCPIRSGRAPPTLS